MKNKNIVKVSQTLIALLFLLVQSATAKVKLAAIFTDHMVLQQQSNVAIWGWARPNAKIKLVTSWNKKEYLATAESNGKWKIKVSTPKAGGPFEITFNDGEALKLTDILIGEVWFCGGQSNMEMPMKGFKSQPIIGSNEAILKSANPKIRLYTVPHWSITTVQEDTKPSEWKLANPENVAGFSATAYYFGQLLNEMLDVPIGLLHDSYGGSSIEAWMSAYDLKAFPEVKVPLPTDTIKDVVRTPTTLYNGMLHAVIGYGIRGAIWYQGESNYERSDRYEDLLPAMVANWRQYWDNGNFPFYYVQIAPFRYNAVPKPDPKANSAYLRDAQRKALPKIPNAGMAVIMDIGEEKMIHPSHKKEGGTRLAYLALTQTYGLKGLVGVSPTYESITIDKDKAVVKFANVPNGLTSFGKELSLFEIAGSDQKFYPAKAVINGSSITVTSTDVKNPVAVRYAFKDFVIGDLFGNEGLPVSSFRTDNW
ncbi:MAG: sialate O-acetylesterase [Pedobacter sp.]|nr:sialate O-acetylesterase [Pedobacter sp.]